MRLSREDGDKTESDSIANQRTLLEAYAADRIGKLKEENQMEWVRRMRNLENRAAEIVKAELIYTFERR